MKIGIAIKVDVSKIDKARLFKGAKGTYLECTTFIDTENPGQFGDHGFISQDVSKEERAQGAKGNILGNCKIFYTAAGQSQNTGQSQHQERQQEYYTENGGNQQPEPETDLPF